MSSGKTLKQRISAFFASDEIKPLLEDGKEYAIVERSATALSDGNPGEDPEDPKTDPPAAETEEGEDKTGTGEGEGEPKPEASRGTAPAPAAAAPKSEITALKERLASTEAAAFVEAEVKAGRLYPAEKNAMQSLYVQAVLDDFASPLAKGSRVESIKASQAARKSHGFTDEKVDAEANEIFVLSMGGNSKTKMDREIESQVDAYVATVDPGNKRLEAVK